MESIAELQRLAEAGDAAAQYRLAAALDRAGDGAGADLWLARAAAAGHPGALYGRAIRLLELPPAQMDAAGAAALLREAAGRGVSLAARKLAVLKALGLGAQEDWDGAVALWSASRQPHAPIGASRAAAQERILRAASPKIATFEGALDAAECAYVVAAAKPLMTPSAVVDPALGGARAAQFRTSDGAAFGLLSLDLPLIAIWKKLCRMAGFEPGRSELMGVLRYRPGQEYRPHHDYLPGDANDYSETKRAGQRMATLLTPLNADYAGGETSFPRLGLSFRLAAGDSLLFDNIDAAGLPIEDSLHAGAPVTAGEKWMLTLWFRQKRFWFW